jgi:predicted nucleic acid-binding protein
MRLILDTNVWLDWLVFDDPSTRPLAARSGALVLLATEPMLAETAAVLARPHFALPQAAQQALLGRQRALVTVCADAPDCRLACTDRHDQKFIDLAVARWVDWLISRDRALLRLHRHASRRFGLRIGTAAQWSSECGSTSPGPAGPGDAAADL